MSKRWLDSQSDAQAASRVEDYWSALRDDLDTGAFWADRIKQYRDEPGKRLQLAMDNLPLPAAFREAAVAIRAIIRAKRKSKDSYEEELGLLYWLAAIESFMLPYADRLGEPGFNVVESIPVKRLRSLPIDYTVLGYEKLERLNKTDKKWMIEAWGEPRAHSTLNRVHRQLWDEYEGKLVQRRQTERGKFARECRELLGTDRPQPKHRKSAVRCLGILIISIPAAIVLSVVLAAISMGSIQ